MRGLSVVINQGYPTWLPQAGLDQAFMVADTLAQPYDKVKIIETVYNDDQLEYGSSPVWEGLWKSQKYFWEDPLIEGNIGLY